MDKECCVVSTHRIKKDNPSQEKFRERLAKVVLHEIGHTLGLEHCAYNQFCLMNDAKGSVRTIDKEKKLLCKQCLEKISYTRIY